MYNTEKTTPTSTEKLDAFTIAPGLYGAWNSEKTVNLTGNHESDVKLLNETFPDVPIAFDLGNFTRDDKGFILFNVRTLGENDVWGDIEILDEESTRFDETILLTNAPKKK